MTADQRRRPVRFWTLLTVIILLGVGLATWLFLPVALEEHCAQLVGAPETCLDALDPAHTSCEVSQLGFAGNQTNGWLWLAAVIATIAVGWILARRRRSQPRR